MWEFRMKTLFYAGAAVIAAMSVSATANATENFGGIIGMTGGPDYFTGSFGTAHTTDFVDTWTFGSSFPAGLADASVINISFADATNISFTEATLNGFAMTISNGAPLATAYTLSQIFSPGGVNTLVLKGVAGGSASYSGTVNFTVAPVPEPTTWAMMIAGLGIAGAALRRRASRVALSFS
jgi:hypothetical protein